MNGCAGRGRAGVRRATFEFSCKSIFRTVLHELLWYYRMVLYCHSSHRRYTVQVVQHAVSCRCDDWKHDIISSLSLPHIVTSDRRIHPTACGNIRVCEGKLLSLQQSILSLS